MQNQRNINCEDFFGVIFSSLQKFYELFNEIHTYAPIFLVCSIVDVLEEEFIFCSIADVLEE